MISSTCAKRGDGKQTKVVCVKPLGPDSVDHCKQVFLLPLLSIVEYDVRGGG